MPIYFQGPHSWKKQRHDVNTTFMVKVMDQQEGEDEAAAMKDCCHLWKKKKDNTRSPTAGEELIHRWFHEAWSKPEDKKG